MPSPGFEQFQRSMNVSHAQRHQGIGYDLDALGRLTDESAHERWIC
jgi:hypothetical protein